MNPKPAIPKGEIRVYWWNLGRRQLEPYMTYATWFSAKGITVTNRAGIYIFKMSLRGPGDEARPPLNQGREPMREIKFRAWDKEYKKWLETDSHLAIALNGKEWWLQGGDVKAVPVQNTGRFIIMQFTGLKDKNDKEIYEGDVVRILDLIQPDEEDGVFPTEPMTADLLVSYRDSSFGVVVPNDYKGQWKPGLIPFWLLFEEGGPIEIIGNIYENPELSRPWTSVSTVERRV